MKNIVTGEAVVATEQPKAEKRVQLTMSQLKELANNSIILKHFIEVIEGGEAKSPTAMVIARMMARQLTIEEAILNEKR